MTILRPNYNVDEDPYLAGTSDGYKAAWVEWLNQCGKAWEALGRGPVINDPVYTWTFGVGRIVNVENDGYVIVVRGSNQNESMQRHYGEVMPSAAR